VRACVRACVCVQEQLIKIVLYLFSYLFCAHSPFKGHALLYNINRREWIRVKGFIQRKASVQLPRAASIA